MARNASNLRNRIGLLRVGETAHREVIRDGEVRTTEVPIAEAETTGRILAIPRQAGPDGTSTGRGAKPCPM